MDWLTRVYNDTLGSLSAALNLLNGLFAGLESWVWGQMEYAGIPRPMQPILVISVWVLLMIVILRMTAGFLRLVVALFLTLLLVHLLRSLLGI